MNLSSPEPIYIHGCGFNSAMGESHSDIHRCIESGVCENMVQDDAVLNSGSSTVVGRVQSTLPTVPVELANYNTRNNQLLLSALLQIETEIKHAIENYGADRIGVVIGSSTSGISDGEIAYQEKLNAGAFPDHYHYAHQELGNSNDFVSNYFGLLGPSYTISTACSSSGRVYLTAKNMLKSGIVDAVIVGGADTLCHLTLNGFNGLEALSNQHCQPFSQDRSGINIGEGAAVMLLSQQPSEIALLGCGDSSDAHHISAPHPDGKGAEQAMRKALADANLKPEQVGYINAHGTATPLNDSMESQAIARVFGNNKPVSSTKTLTGHTLGAASAVEAAIAWHILKYDLNLPKQHCKHIDSQVEIKLVETDQQLEQKRILSNSFAFGGNNVSLIFGKINE